MARPHAQMFQAFQICLMLEFQKSIKKYTNSIVCIEELFRFYFRGDFVEFVPGFVDMAIKYAYFAVQGCGWYFERSFRASFGVWILKFIRSKLIEIKECRKLRYLKIRAFRNSQYFMEQ